MKNIVNGIVSLGQNHLQGEGKIIIQPCNVRFYIVVPLEPYTTPYTIVASFGTHSHPPPPITKTPHYLMAQLQKVISKKDTLNLTTSINTLSHIISLIMC